MCIRDRPYTEGQLYAAAWLGWQDTGDLSRYADLCPGIEEAPVLHLSDGEYWLILPRYPGTALEVSQLDINTSEARLVYSCLLYTSPLPSGDRRG